MRYQDVFDKVEEGLRSTETLVRVNNTPNYRNSGFHIPKDKNGSVWLSYIKANEEQEITSVEKEDVIRMATEILRAFGITELPEPVKYGYEATITARIPFNASKEYAEERLDSIRKSLEDMDFFGVYSGKVSDVTVRVVDQDE